MLAEIHHLACEMCPRRVRQHDLPAVRDAGDPCRTVHVETDVTAVLEERHVPRGSRSAPGSGPPSSPEHTT